MSSTGTVDNVETVLHNTKMPSCQIDSGKRQVKDALRGTIVGLKRNLNTF